MFISQLFGFFGVWCLNLSVGCSDLSLGAWICLWALGFVFGCSDLSFGCSDLSLGARTCIWVVTESEIFTGTIF